MTAPAVAACAACFCCHCLLVLCSFPGHARVSRLPCSGAGLEDIQVAAVRVGDVIQVRAALLCGSISSLLLAWLQRTLRKENMMCRCFVAAL